MSRRAVHDFCERMADGKARAFERAQRGQSGRGKVAKVSDYAPIERDSWEYGVAVARSAWRHARADAVECFRFEAFPERYEIEL